MEFPTHSSDQLSQSPLIRRVDILVTRLDFELTLCPLILNQIQPPNNLLRLRIGDDA